MTPESWWLRADCRTQESQLWFPERGESAEPARRICLTCPVMAECRDYALTSSMPLLGVWGGMSEREREKARRKPRKVFA